MRTIRFHPSSEECQTVVPSPQPARTYVPDWYRQTPSGHATPTYKDGKLRQTVKACVPFADALRTGWIQETWCDIHIHTHNGVLNYHYSSTPKPITHREMTPDQVRISTNAYEPLEMTWIAPWMPEMPRGWSVLFSHPMNRLDLPFTVMSGIVDSDRFFHTPLGQVPFYVHRGFTGVIPAGTPMYQMTPIRRTERWLRQTLTETDKTIRQRAHQIERRFRGAYRDEFWIPKHYD